MIRSPEYRKRTLRAAAFAPFLLFADASYATDGVIEINQERAIAGGVTSGDTAGFPVTISQVGSYRLTGNLTVTGGLDGILVSAENVDVDLNGFAIVGDGAGNGVIATQPFCRVRNGAVSGFAVGVATNSTFRCVIEDMRVTQCAAGILTGFQSAVRRCLVTGATGTAISIADGSVEGCTLTDNLRGIVATLGTSRLTGNTLTGNQRQGIAITRGVVEGNTVSSNGTAGTDDASRSGINVTGAAASCSIVGNAINGNTGAGIAFTGGAVAANTGISNNVVTGNGAAFFGGMPTTMSGNVVQP
jgi:parallel beta-helix repeat protein